MEYAYGTDAGLCREINEDSVGVFNVGGVFTVALLLDGMGGANGGRIASSLALETMTTELELRLSFLLCTKDKILRKEVGEILAQACEAVNRTVWERADQNSELHGMGTTLVAAVLFGEHCCILNVGDSRGYYVSDGQISQITKDQSYLQYLLDREILTEAQADHFSEKNVIMSAVGTERTVRSDLYYLNFQGNDEEYLLLTSDGLHDMLGGDAIGKIVSQRDCTLKEKVRKLIDSANMAGGEDNISAILLRLRKAG